MKEMMTHHELSWRRNVESKTVDGLRTRSLEEGKKEGKIMNEPVFLGRHESRPEKD